MEGDSDSDGTDSKAGWPTRLLDLGRDAENSRSAIEELIGLFIDKLHLVSTPKPSLHSPNLITFSALSQRVSSQSLIKISSRGYKVELDPQTIRPTSRIGQHLPSQPPVSVRSSNFSSWRQAAHFPGSCRRPIACTGACELVGPLESCLRATADSHHPPLHWRSRLPCVDLLFFGSCDARYDEWFFTRGILQGCILV